MVQASGYGAWGVGFGVWGLGSGVWVLQVGVRFRSGQDQRLNDVQITHFRA